jgi:hypothetical protein
MLLLLQRIPSPLCGRRFIPLVSPPLAGGGEEEGINYLCLYYQFLL